MDWRVTDGWGLSRNGDESRLARGGVRGQYGFIHDAQAGERPPKAAEHGHGAVRRWIGGSRTINSRRSSRQRRPSMLTTETTGMSASHKIVSQSDDSAERKTLAQNETVPLTSTPDNSRGEVPVDDDGTRRSAGGARGDAVAASCAADDTEPWLRSRPPARRLPHHRDGRKTYLPNMTTELT